MTFQLAQANIARMRAGLDDPLMAGLVTRLDEVNALAEQSDGFIWRLLGSEGTLEALRPLEDYLVPFEPERLFYNMSVWQSVDHLRNYVYKSSHVELLREKHRWTMELDCPALVMWWVPAGEWPTISDSVERFQTLAERGPAPQAFTLERSFPSPAA